MLTSILSVILIVGNGIRTIRGRVIMMTATAPPPLYMASKHSMFCMPPGKSRFRQQSRLQHAGNSFSVW
jgi:hypothetical protein